MSSGLTFDPSISLGTLINAAMLLIAVVAAFSRIGGRIDLLALRMRALEEVLNSNKDISSRLIVVEERLNHYTNMMMTAQRDISDLRRGVGFVTRGRESIDGEYSRGDRGRDD